MRWNKIVEILDCLPDKRPEFFNSLVDTVLSKTENVSQDDKVGVVAFRHQLNQLKINNNDIDVSVPQHLQDRWYRLLVLLAKQYQYSFGKSYFDALCEGLADVSTTVTKNLASWLKRFGLNPKPNKFLFNLMNAVIKGNSVANKNWYTQQEILYVLLALRNQVNKLKNSEDKHLTEIDRLLGMALYGFRGDVPNNYDYINDDLEQEHFKNCKKMNAAPFYACLQMLMIKSACRGPYAALNQIKKMVETNLFNVNKEDEVKHCQRINLHAKWLKALNKLWVPPLWQNINEGDKQAVDRLTKQLNEYTKQSQYAFELPTDKWINQLVEHAKQYEDVMLPWIGSVLCEQIDEGVRDVLAKEDCTLSELTRLYECFPKKCKTESLLLTLIIRSFAEASNEQKLAFVETAFAREFDREKASGKINPHVKILLEQLSRENLSQTQNTRLKDLINERNSIIDRRTKGFFGFFRRKERAHKIETFPVDKFIGEFTNREYLPEAELKQTMRVTMGPYTVDVSDDDYRKSVQQKFQGDEEGLTTLEQGKLRTFNDIVGICQGDANYQRALVATLPKAVVPQLGETLKDTDLKNLPNGGVLLTQSVNAVKKAMDDPTSALAQVFNEADIVKLKRLVQIYDDIDQMEEELCAINSDDDLDIFYTTLSRRLSGLWLTAHIISTNDVATQASTSVRWLSGAATVGGGLLSMPVLSGAIAATGESLKAADAYRIYDNYIQLQKYTPSGTSAEILAQMVARIITLRYARQIHFLEKGGIRQFVEYCFQKIKGRLLSQTPLQVPDGIEDDPNVYSPTDALKNSAVAKHAFTIAQIISEPADSRYIAIDSKPAMGLFKRLKLNSRKHYGKEIWNAEAMLVEPDMLCAGKLFRSPYATHQHGRRSEYGIRLATRGEIAAFNYIGDMANEVDNDMSRLPPSVQRMLINLEARANFAYQRSLQTSAQIKQLTSQPSAPQRYILPSQIRESRPKMITDAVDQVIPDVDFKTISTVNKQLDNTQTSYEAMAAKFEQEQTMAEPATPSTPQNMRTPVRGQMPTITSAHTPLTGSPFPRLYRPRTPHSTRSTQAPQVAPIPALPTEKQLKDEIMTKTKRYCVLREADNRRNQPPCEERKNLRPVILNLMYQYCLMHTYYNVEQAIFLFNHWCGYDGEVLTPQKMLRKKVNQASDPTHVQAPVEEENDASNSIFNPSGMLPTPMRLPRSPMLINYA